MAIWFQILTFALALAAHATVSIVFIARYVTRIEVRLALIEAHISQEVPATRAGMVPVALPTKRRFGREQ